MGSLTLEKRVQVLESQIANLQEELRNVRVTGAKDWRRTIGAFADDDGMKSLFQDAMRLRELDRKKTRPKTSRSRKGSK